MHTIYKNINTFSDEIYKSDLREKILNPMIVQHNSMGLDITTHSDRLDKLEANGGGGGITKFEDLHDVPAFEANKYLKVSGSGDLEWGSVSTSGDVSRFEAIEKDVTGLKGKDVELNEAIINNSTRIQNHEGRIAVIENGPVGSSTFKNLTDTPDEYGSAGQLVAVGPNGNELVYVNAPTGGGVAPTTFTSLTDTPASHEKDKMLVSDGSKLVFQDVPSAGTPGVDTFLALKDTPQSFENGKILESTTSGLVWVDKPASGGPSTTTFKGLTDTPNDYQSGKILKGTSSGVEWADMPASGASKLTDLTDTPNNYQAGKILESTASGAIWVDKPEIDYDMIAAKDILFPSTNDGDKLASIPMFYCNAHNTKVELPKIVADSATPGANEVYRGCLRFIVSSDKRNGFIVKPTQTTGADQWKQGLLWGGTTEYGETTFPGGSTLILMSTALPNGEWGGWLIVSHVAPK